MVKVIDWVLYKLNDMVRPVVQKILHAITPLLIEDDYYARVEGWEILSNLAKAAGHHYMIQAMRDDLDSSSEDVWNTISRAFAVVTTTLGVSVMFPFI